MEKSTNRTRGSFWRDHSLSVVSIGLLGLFIFAYSRSDPNTHVGAFFGNAVADWSGSVVIILGTKFLLETGSAESRPARRHLKNPLFQFLYRHSLLLFLFVTGIGWLVLYLRMDPQSKSGEVVGNIGSES